MSGGFKFRKRTLRATVLALGLATPAVAATSTPSLEYSVKAAFLYKFGGFVAWPQTAFDSADSPTTICIVGEDPFGGALEKAGVGQRIADHHVTIRRMEEIGQKSGCQILFLAGKDEKKIAQALAAVRGEGVLTITDGVASPAARGIINFIIADNRVRFEIDDHAASVNGMVISSKLLDLARATKKRS